METHQADSTAESPPGLLNGAAYLVNSQRKGTFVGKLKSHGDTWATFEITAGRAKAMLEYNERDKGEDVTVRRAFCTLTPQPLEGGAA